MKKGNNLGRVIIDELRICYMPADNGVMDILRQIEEGKSYGLPDIGMRLHRIPMRHFRYGFAVDMDIDGEMRRVASLYFGKSEPPTDGDNGCFDRYVWLKVENRALYFPDIFREIFRLPIYFGFTFHNITALDLAVDTTRNSCGIVRRLMRNPELDTIINGKVITDRKGVIDGAMAIYSVSLDRIKYPTLCFKQKKAEHDKTRGVCVTIYGKNKCEKASRTAKEYILDFYDRPRSLHRTEVHLNGSDVSDYLKEHASLDTGKGTKDGHGILEQILSPKVLYGMFIYHLESVIKTYLPK